MVGFPDSDSEIRFENRSIFDEIKAYEVKAYKMCVSFLGHPV